MLCRNEEGVAAAYNALKINPDLFEAVALKGSGLLYFHKFRKALDAFDRAIELNDTDASVWSCKGYLLMKPGEYKRPARVFDRCLQIIPEFPDAAKNKDFSLAQLQKGGHM